MTPDHARRVAAALLEYVVVDLRADAGAVYSIVKGGTPYRVAQTILANQTLDHTTRTAWACRSAALLRFEPVRFDDVAVWPLFDDGRRVIHGLLTFCNGADPATAHHLHMLRRLAVLLTSVGGPAPAHIEVSQAVQITNALAACEGIVARAARMLGRPPRTLWDQMKRFDISPSRYRQGRAHDDNRRA